MGLSDLITPDERPYRPTQKPPKGSARAARVAKRLKKEAKESTAKSAARKRDGYRCRWPHCDCEERRDRIEVAHLVNKSQQGKNDPKNLITLCVARHQGNPSLHSGDLEIRPVDPRQGANGPVEFWKRDKSGRFYLVAREIRLHQLERD